MLTLPIKRKWFEMIKSGEKKEEYRTISKYYDSRIGKYLDQNIELILRNGYSSTSPIIKILCKITIGEGKTEWGAIKGEKYYILKIIKVYN